MQSRSGLLYRNEVEMHSVRTLSILVEFNEEVHRIGAPNRYSPSTPMLNLLKINLGIYNLKS
jgi:hypothetical protein